MKNKILPCCKLCIKYHQNLCQGANKEIKEYCRECPSRIDFKTKIMLVFVKILAKISIFVTRVKNKFRVKRTENVERGRKAKGKGKQEE